MTLLGTSDSAYREVLWGTVNGSLEGLTPRDIALMAGGDLSFGGTIVIDEHGAFTLTCRIED